MLRPRLLLSALVACGLPAALADTIQLKDKAAITGKVLAEKSDHIAVDVGYTVLVIPRNQIVKILKSDDAAPAAKPSHRPKAAASGSSEVAEPKPGFYWAPTNPLLSAPCSSW